MVRTQTNTIDQKGRFYFALGPMKPDHIIQDYKTRYINKI